MSLLLKALQRASKTRDTLPRNETPSSRRDPPGGLELEPGDIEPTGGERRDFAFAGVPRGGARPEPQDEERLGVGTGGAGTRAMDWIRDHPVHTFAGVAFLFMLGYGGYVYIVINHPTLLTRRPGPVVGAANRPLPPAPPPTREAPAAAPVATNPLPPAPLPALRVAPPDAGAESPRGAGERAAEATPAPPREATATVPMPLPTVEIPPAAARPAPAKPASRRPRAETTDREMPADPAPRPAVAARPKPARPTADAASAPLQEGVQIRSTDAGDHQAARLAEAYDALQHQDAARAEALYAAVLNGDPRNVDALLGMAAVSWQRGRTEAASDYYYKVLQFDPQNAAAQAGLIGMVGRVDPLASESRLKQLIDREPSGYLYAALGHLHAGQGQWAPAQQAYFQAFQLEPANPDYAYNLAVGLEHLGQRKIAVSYYRKALDLARARGQAGFDQKTVAARIERLGAAVE